jgi:hypothetical protein
MLSVVRAEWSELTGAQCLTFRRDHHEQRLDPLGEVCGSIVLAHLLVVAVIKVLRKRWLIGTAIPI